MKTKDLYGAEENARFVSLLMDLMHISILYKHEMSREQFEALMVVIDFIGERELYD